MKRSDKRILTTHAGSLLRPKALGEMQGRHSRHEAVDADAMDRAIFDATRS
jgi:methionine synthase II (cobalamin-independent)